MVILQTFRGQHFEKEFSWAPKLGIIVGKARITSVFFFSFACVNGVTVRPHMNKKKNTYTDW